MKVYIVATIQNQPSDVCLFADIILVTDNLKKARTAKYQIEGKKPLPGLDYSLLAPYNSVIYFERELNEMIQNNPERRG